MDEALEKFRLDIEEFLARLKIEKKAFQESMINDEMLASTKQILLEIRNLESTIASIVERHFERKN
jgi:hypothetical protein